MGISIDQVAEEALRVLKVHQKVILLYPPGSPATEALRYVFATLDIPYAVLEDPEHFKAIERMQEAAFYTLDLSAMACNGSRPDIERLQQYWEDAPTPRTL